MRNFISPPPIASAFGEQSEVGRQISRRRVRIARGYRMSYHLARFFRKLVCAMKQLSKLTLLIVAGLPGAGKSAVAHALLQRCSMDYVSTDEYWSLMFPHATYTVAESIKVFDRVCEEVSLRLSQNRSVVTEGVFASHERITHLRRIADEHRASTVIIGLHCEAAVAMERLQSRYLANGSKPMPMTLWRALESKLKLWKDQEQSLWIDSTRVTIPTATAMILRDLSRS